MTDYPTPPTPAFVFDLDGTLVDSVYHHVIAWHRAFAQLGLNPPLWMVHRRIGMSGSLLAKALLDECGRAVTEQSVQQAKDLHAEAFAEMRSAVQPLDGARDLLEGLTERGVAWSIATSGNSEDTKALLEMLGLDDDVKVVTGSDISNAKPEPDLFLAGAALLGAQPRDCVIVGDSVWDLLAARRAHALGVGVLCGGYSEGELVAAHAFRVYQGPAQLLASLSELGIAG